MGKAGTFSASEKNKLEQRIKGKFKVIHDSLGSEKIEESQIADTMLQQRGVFSSSEDLETQYQALHRQREELVEPLIRDKRNELRIQVSDIENQKSEELKRAQLEMKQKITELKSNFATQKREIENRYDAEAKELKNALEEAREQVIKDKTQEQSEQLETLKREQMRVSQIEAEVKIMAKTRTAVLRKTAGRVTQVLDDALNNFLEELLFLELMEDGKNLLERIPGVPQVMEMMESPDGIQLLIQTLNPKAAQIMSNSMRLTHQTVAAEQEAERVDEAQIVEAQEKADTDVYVDVEVTADDLEDATVEPVDS